MVDKPRARAVCFLRKLDELTRSSGLELRSMNLVDMETGQVVATDVEWMDDEEYRVNWED